MASQFRRVAPDRVIRGRVALGEIKRRLARCLDQRPSHRRAKRARGTDALRGSGPNRQASSGGRAARTNQSLARANTELSQKNRELDEFVYVVSHDLQEPLRTLIGFSEFLLKNHAHQLDAQGQEFVNYLFDASRRMRAMIHGLLKLSRAGKVTGEFSPVSSGRTRRVVKTDLGELIRSQGALVRWSVPRACSGVIHRLHHFWRTL